MFKAPDRNDLFKNIYWHSTDPQRGKGEGEAMRGRGGGGGGGRVVGGALGNMFSLEVYTDFSIHTKQLPPWRDGETPYTLSA